MPETTNLKLPTFNPDDKPSWLGSWNGAMNAIDQAVGRIDGDIAETDASIEAAQTAADAAKTAADAAQAAATALQGQVSQNKTDIQSQATMIETLQDDTTEQGRKINDLSTKVDSFSSSNIEFSDGMDDKGVVLLVNGAAKAIFINGIFDINKRQAATCSIVGTTYKLFEIGTLAGDFRHIPTSNIAGGRSYPVTINYVGDSTTNSNLRIILYYDPSDEYTTVYIGSNTSWTPSIYSALINLNTVYSSGTTVSNFRKS